MASLRASLTYNAKKRFGTVVDMYFCSTYSAATDASALNSLRTRKWAGLHAFQVSPASVGFSHRESVRTNLVPALPNPTYSVPHIPVTPLRNLLPAIRSSTIRSRRILSKLPSFMFAHRTRGEPRDFETDRSWSIQSSCFAGSRTCCHPHVFLFLRVSYLVFVRL
jgi:hypothetical protein